MKFKNTLWVILTGLCLTFTFIQADERKTNMLRDYELERFTENWSAANLTTTFKRKQIESFEGMPETLNYIEGQGKCTLTYPSVTVKPDTWYVVTAVYRNQNRMKPEPSDPPFELLMGVKSSTEKDPWKSFATSLYGNCSKWTHPKLYFNSGDRKQIDLVLMFYCTEGWDIGRIVMTELPHDEERSLIIQDGDFENNVVGGQATDLRRTGYGKIRPEILKDPDAKSGSHILNSDIEAGRASLYANPLLLFPGDKVRLLIWAKSKLPMQCSLSIESLSESFHAKSSIKINSKWKLIEIDTVVAKNKLHPFLAKVRIDFNTPTVNSVQLDNYAAAIIPYSKKQSNSKNLIRTNPSFEIGIDGWASSFIDKPNEHTTGGKISLDASDAAHGKYSLFIQKPAAKDLSNGAVNLFKLRTMLTQINAGKTYSLSFMARADRPTQMKASFAYDSFGTFSLTPQWQEFRASTLCSKTYYGVNSNRLVFYSSYDGATIWLDKIQLEENKSCTEFQYPVKYEIGTELYKDRYKIYSLNDKIYARSILSSYVAQPQKVQYVCNVKNYKNQEIWHDRKKITLKPDSPTELLFNLPSSRYGWFVVETKIMTEDNMILGSTATTYAVVPEAKEIPAEQSWFGLYSGDANCLRKGRKGAYIILTSGTYAERLGVYRKLGFHWLRNMPIGCWANIEPEEGSPDWSIWDTTIDMIKSQGIKILVDFMSWDRPKWAEAKDKKASHGLVARLEPAAKFARQFAAHYRGRIDAIQLMNETGGYSPLDFYELAKAIHPVFKKYAPEISLNLPSNPSSCLPLPGGDNYTWVGKVMNMGLTRFTDVVDIHPYIDGHAKGRVSALSKIPQEANLIGKWGSRGETLTLSLKEFREKYGNIPIWDSESGFVFNTSAPWMKTSEESEAQWYTPAVAAGRMVRWGIEKMGMGMSRQMYFMFYLNLPYHGLDLMNSDMTPRPGVPAYAAFAKMLDGAKHIQKITIGSDTWIHLFKDGKNTVAVYWNYNLENKDAGSLVLAGKPFSYELFDMMGNQLNSKPGSLLLESTPIYLVSDAPFETVTDAFSNSRVYGTNECSISLGFGNTEKGSPVIFCGVHNLMNEPLKGKSIKIKGDGALVADTTIKIPDLSSESEITLSVPARLTQEPLIHFSAKLLTGKSNAGQLSRPVAWIKKTDKEVIVDGNVDDIYGEPVIVLHNPKKSSFSGTLYARWNEDALYLASSICDKTIKTAPKNKPIYLGDSIEYYFNFSAKKSLFAKNYPLEAIRISLSCKDGGRIEYDRDGVFGDITNFDYFDSKKIKYASKTTDAGYVIEIKIPMSKKLYHNNIIAFNYQIANSGNERKSDNCIINWTGVSSWNNINGLGAAILFDMK